MKDDLITVIAAMDIVGEDYIHDSTDFIFYKNNKNAMNFIFDDYFNGEDWDVVDTKQNGYNDVLVFTFSKSEQPEHHRMLIIEKVDMDSEEMELFADIIEFSD